MPRPRTAQRSLFEAAYTAPVAEAIEGKTVIARLRSRGVKVRKFGSCGEVVFVDEAAESVAPLDGGG